MPYWPPTGLSSDLPHKGRKIVVPTPGDCHGFGHRGRHYVTGSVDRDAGAERSEVPEELRVGEAHANASMA